MSSAPHRLHLMVEGEGDAAAVPKLVHRIWREHDIHHFQLTPQPFHAGGIYQARKHLERYVGAAMMNRCPVLWVLDCDDKTDGTLGCPVEHVKALRAALAHVHQPQPLEFAFFTKEFESLFLAEEASLRAHYQLPDTTAIDPRAAQRRDAKGTISALLPSGRAYKETTDQAALTSRLNLATCRKVSRDYRHFESALLRLCGIT